MKYLIGRKIGMTQRFLEDGRAASVTVIEAGPCTVTAIKGTEKDGYKAIQLGYGETKKLSKAEKGHLKNLPPYGVLKEFPIIPGKEMKVGDTLSVEQFAANDLIDVTGVSKGKGFQGVVKRHGFGGSPATHGHKDQLRMPGSIGAGGPQRVFKGTRMAGRMGNAQATLRNIRVIEVDPQNNLLFIEGSVPGANTAIVFLYSDAETAGTPKKTEEQAAEKPVEVQKEEVKAETPSAK